MRQVEVRVTACSHFLFAVDSAAHIEERSSIVGIVTGIDLVRKIKAQPQTIYSLTLARKSYYSCHWC
jgi:hypothetical protein